MTKLSRRNFLLKKKPGSKSDKAPGKVVDKNTTRNSDQAGAGEYNDYFTRFVDKLLNEYRGVFIVALSAFIVIILAISYFSNAKKDNIHGYSRDVFGTLLLAFNSQIQNESLSENLSAGIELKKSDIDVISKSFASVPIRAKYIAHLLSVYYKVDEASLSNEQKKLFNDLKNEGSFKEDDNLNKWSQVIGVINDFEKIDSGYILEIKDNMFFFI